MTPPATPGRLSRAESMALTREKLLAAALKTFLKVGFAAATIDGISEDAGFSRGAFYANFTSKEEIFLAAIAATADDVTPALIERLAAATSPAQAIAIMSDWAEQRSQSQDLAYLMLEVMQHARRNGTLDERYGALFNRNWRGVGEALRPFFPDQQLPGSPEEIVAIIVALTYGPIVSGASGHKAGRLVELVLKGMMRQP